MKVEISESGVLIGNFSTVNCYGREKVRRLMSVQPERATYHLTVYGDSKVDRELMKIADISYKI